jgi:hypothetical protein
LLAASLVILAAVACAPPQLPEVSNGVPVAAECGGSIESRFFPGERLRWFPKQPIPVADWTRGAAEILEVMREPPLSCGAQPDSYRILWLHSFSSWPPTGVSKFPPTMVRVSFVDDAWTLTAVQLAGSVNRKETMRSGRRLTEEEALYVLATVNGFGLWNRKDFAWDTGVMDGALWVVEGRRGRGYHPAFLANVDEKATGKLAAVFFNLAGIDSIVLTGGR